MIGCCGASPNFPIRALGSSTAAVKPLPQLSGRYVTRHAAGPGGFDEDEDDADGDPGVDRSIPKNCTAASAMPPPGRLCPAPWMLYASTTSA